MRRKVLIELEPTLSSCIETLAKKEYNRVLGNILRGESEDEGLSERLETLRLFLESADFNELRSKYEGFLEEGKRVIFRIYLTDGKPAYELIIR